MGAPFEHATDELIPTGTLATSIAADLIASDPIAVCRLAYDVLQTRAMTWLLDQVLEDPQEVAGIVDFQRLDVVVTTP